MERMKGRILDGDTVIAENLDVVILETPSRTGRPDWRGSFEVSFDVNIEPGRDEYYELVLEDGRSGKILITNIRISSQTQSKSIKFVVSGGLE